MGFNETNTLKVVLSEGVNNPWHEIKKVILRVGSGVQMNIVGQNNKNNWQPARYAFNIPVAPYLKYYGAYSASCRRN